MDQESADTLKGTMAIELSETPSQCLTRATLLEYYAWELRGAGCPCPYAEAYGKIRSMAFLDQVNVLRGLGYHWNGASWFLPANVSDQGQS